MHEISLCVWGGKGGVGELKATSLLINKRIGGKGSHWISEKNENNEK
jgi:hypothetical protein